MKEIRYASLLHDFGKVGVREEVLTKARKLYPEQMEVIAQPLRFRPPHPAGREQRAEAAATCWKMAARSIGASSRSSIPNSKSN